MTSSNSNSSTSPSSSAEERAETETVTTAAASVVENNKDNTGDERTDTIGDMVGSSSEILAETLKHPHYNNQKINVNNNNNNKINRNTSSVRSEPIGKYEMSERLQSMMRNNKEPRSLSASNVNRMAENTVLPKPPRRGRRAMMLSQQEQPSTAGSRPNLSTRRVSVREMNYNIPALADMGDHVDEVHGEESWRAQIIHFIHQKWVQRTMLILLCLDVVGSDKRLFGCRYQSFEYQDKQHHRSVLCRDLCSHDHPLHSFVHKNF